MIRAMVLLAILLSASGQAATIKLATWNLNWLTTRSGPEADLPNDVHLRQPADFARLRAYADHLAADVVAFEEVDGIRTAALVFDPARYTLLTIGENVVQQVGLAVRRDIAIGRNPDLSALDVTPEAHHRLRDGLDVTLKFADGATLRLLVVHLKTGCHTDQLATSSRPQCALLRQQIPPLANWAAARAAEGGAFAIAGDFNRIMDTPETLGEALRGSALKRVTEGASDPCWEGGSFIDHIFLGGPAKDWLVPGSLRVMTYQGADPGDKERLSDHCPVSIRLEEKPGG